MPKVDAASTMARYRSLHQTLSQGLVASVHDCSDGGGGGLLAIFQIIFLGDEATTNPLAGR
ncbi:MAG: hypothetical protein RRB13_11195 [bacterium]|nr:hypothetical protein [bacterium]